MSTNNGNQANSSRPDWANWTLEALPWLVKIMCLVIIIAMIVISLVNPAAGATIIAFVVLFNDTLRAMNAMSG